MRIAVEGCCHGELDDIYATIKQAQESDGKVIDLLLICGDFQAIRNYSDLLSLAVPEKYRQLGGFYKYYAGEVKAPLLTIVIGGNHEASNYMWELFHGGWLAPNIYYLGAAGSVLVNGLRISGASGIYKSGDYRKGRFERHPYDRSTIRSIYHTREYDITRLSQLALISAYPSIVLSHDWPLGIEQYGDTAALIRRKPFFKEEITSNTLGSSPLMGLLELLKPAYWFSAHLHVKFAALFKHNGQRTKVQTNFNNRRNGPQPTQTADAEGTSGNPDELVIDDDDDDAVDEDPAHHHAEARPAPADALIHPQQPQPGSADTLADPDGPDESVDVKAGNVGNSDEVLMSNDDTQTSAITASAETNGSGSKNPDEIAMDDEEDDENKGATEAPAQQVPREHACKCNCEAESTHFLALSKCLPGQDFLQILDIAAPDQNVEAVMTYDPAWLAITRAFHPQLSLTYQQSPLPRESTICKGMIEKELAWIKSNLPNGGSVPVTNVQQFQQTAPYPGQPGGDERGPGSWFTNPQTESLCRFLGLENKVNPIPPELRAQLANLPPPNNASTA